MPSPNFNDRPAGKTINTIVLHHTGDGGTAQDTGRYFQDRSSQVSSHYIIGKDGTIVQPVQADTRAWLAGASTYKGESDVNDFSLGIEITNKGDDRDPYTDAQYESLSSLVAWMMQTYNIPMERITGHKNVAVPRGRKDDPSANFDVERLKRMVNQKLGR
jgi:N-acetylmuramoyl-L-alanine amidase